MQVNATIEFVFRIFVRNFQENYVQLTLQKNVYFGQINKKMFGCVELKQPLFFSSNQKYNCKVNGTVLLDILHWNLQTLTERHRWVGYLPLVDFKVAVGLEP